ncbi:MAG TPA: ATP-binding cassette domain-containing protein [Acidimicrobiales bacterium]|nr:ATP-binding cassette domain-containing protein [Acidimicrobiales bacterium]
MIRFEDVYKRYGNGTYAVTGLDLEVVAGELCVLVGPSGGGKTTILRMVNRLVEPTSGKVLVDGRDVATMDAVALRRRTGYVIQQPGLFPHLKVADNVASVPRLLGWDRERARARVNELLELVGLDPGTYAGRYPHELSGGQAQRVGVARALAGDPPVLLMDEPFAAVDPIARERLQQEFLRLQAHLHKTVIMVTHDVDEAVTMGDRIAVLSNGGVLQQHDTPAELLARPATPFVADFIGADRGLRRLAVTPIDIADLYSPPVVAPRSSLSEARAAVAREGTSWAIVVDENGKLLGWLEPGRLGGPPGPESKVQDVMNRIHPLEAQVPVGSSLKTAFAEMLQHDAGWVAVLDGDSYLGVLTPEALHAALRRSVGGDPVPV